MLMILIHTDFVINVNSNHICFDNQLIFWIGFHVANQITTFTWTFNILVNLG